MTPASRREPVELLQLPEKRKRRRHSRWPLSLRATIFLGVCAGILALAAIILLRYVPAYQALDQGRTDVLGAESVLRSTGLNPSRDQLTQATGLLREAASDFGSRSLVIDDGWGAFIAAHLPVLGPNVSAVQSLRHAGAAATQIALDLVPVLDQLHQAPAAGSGVVNALASLGQTQASPITDALRELDTFDAAVSATPATGLFGPVAHLRDTVLSAQQRLDGPVRTGLTIIQSLPHLAGGGTHRYLLLLGNPGEERGGGGFIGAVGTVIFQDGRLVSSDFMSSDFSDALVTNIPAPDPIAEITGTALVLADSNWSPDFPTSAAVAAQFFTRATGQQVDGVINVDPIALSYVLKVIGPVSVPPFPQIVRPNNALLELNYIINQARPGDPGKAYLAPFGHAVVGAALKTSRSDWVALATALEQGAREKHIVLDFNDPSLERLVVRAAIGGTLTPTPPGDSVLVADSNLSGTKGDLFVTRHYDLSASVDVKGHVTDRLTLTYHNPQVTTAADAQLLSNSGGLYDDYIRVYLPSSASLDDILVSADGAPAQSQSAEDVGVEASRQWVAFRILLDVNQSTQVTFVYDGQFTNTGLAGAMRYQLTWQKQIDALTWPITVEVRIAGQPPVKWQDTLSADRMWQTGA